MWYIMYMLFATLTATKNTIGGHPVVEEIDLNIEMMPPPRDPIATPQASSVPLEPFLNDGMFTQDQRVPEESLYDGGVGPTVPLEQSLYDGMFTQDQRVPEESLCDGGVGPTGNVPTGRGGNVQEALYSRPDTSKKNADVSLLSTDNRITSCEDLYMHCTLRCLFII